MVLVAMLSSSAFAVVKSVHLDSTQTIAESGLVYGSWKIIRLQVIKPQRA